MSDNKGLDGWVSVFSTGTDYEAELVHSRLADAGLTAVIHSKRDHAYSLNVGTMSMVHVMVAPEESETAHRVLASPPFSDAELEDMAMRADPDRPPEPEA